jgi:2-amino-4-hydroxy-6-hydroxymethyldihydropteridine diphosphokinase
MRVVIGLGANVGDRMTTMREAVRRIGQIAMICGRSPVYETKPIGGPAQPAFLNAAILANYNYAPLSLLDELQRIENDLGRKREVRWGPRTIDLDILWMSDGAVDEPRLRVPHPRLTERAFALAPLLDVFEAAIDPHTQKPYVPPPHEDIRLTSLVL